MKGRNSDSTPKHVARLLRALASLVESSSPDEVATFLEGQASLSRGKRRHASEDDRLPLDVTPPVPADLPKLAENLHSLSSRDEGLSLLSSASLTRRELEALGRLLGTPILKTDNMERLTEKIIEASIGSRLTSEAIRGDRVR